MNFGEKTLRSAYLSAPLVDLKTAIVCARSWSGLVESDIEEAYENYDSTSGLKKDESAAMTLYTGYYISLPLNQALRTQDLIKIQPWFGYLRLLHAAFWKLPTVKGTFCYTKHTDQIEAYNVGSIVTSVNRCSSLASILSFTASKDFLTAEVVAIYLDDFLT